MEKDKELIYGTMAVLADVIENRDEGKGGHIERVTSHLKTLIDGMLERAVYKHELNKLDLELLIPSACLYDVGKITVPDVILNKPGRLSKEEFDIIKTHAIKGEHIIEKILSKTDKNEDFLHYAKLFAGNHHELWNGRGYPRGLGKTDIPIQGRMMAILDVFDALVSQRPYKTPFTAEEAFKIIMDGAGEQFDPLIVEVFLEINEKFKNHG
ncbi:MAG: HD domain-containing protein [Treponema sp.]|nr:HD domain-containing protein [Treponema sp.]